MKVNFIDCSSDILILKRLPPFTDLMLDKEKVYDIDIKQHREKRSLNANAYFHVLVDKLSKALTISFAACKNELITSYGVIDYISEGEPWIYKTNAPPEFMREREEVHGKFIKQGDDGAFWYRMYKGSHTYDTKEFSQLLEGTIQECQAVGIETITPQELERMLKEWEKHNATKGQKPSANSQGS